MNLRMKRDSGNYSKLALCIDCVYLIANGECDPDVQDEVSDALAKTQQGGHITLGTIHDDMGVRGEDHEECECDETWFSWSSCDGCNRHLGGERHHAVYWPND